MLGRLGASDEKALYGKTGLGRQEEGCLLLLPHKWWKIDGWADL